jgi:hypothetical protein
MNPEYVIVAMVVFIALVMLTAGLLANRARQRRMIELRRSPEICLPVQSSWRVAAALLAIIAITVVGGLGLFIRFDPRHVHGLAFVVSLLLVDSIAIGLLALDPLGWFTIGSVRLDRHAATLEVTLGRQVRALPLDGRITLREWYRPGNFVYTVVVVERDGASLAFTYPNGLREPLLAPQGAIGRPAGVVLGAEGRVIHEHLRRIACPDVL